MEKKKTKTAVLAETVGEYGKDILENAGCLLGGLGMLGVLAIPCIILLEDLLNIFIPEQRYVVAGNIWPTLLLVVISLSVFAAVSFSLSHLCEALDQSRKDAEEILETSYKLVVALIPMLLLSTINDSIIKSLFTGKFRIDCEVNLTTMVMTLVLFVLAVTLRYLWKMSETEPEYDDWLYDDWLNEEAEADAKVSEEAKTEADTEEKEEKEQEADTEVKEKAEPEKKSEGKEESETEAAAEPKEATEAEADKDAEPKDATEPEKNTGVKEESERKEDSEGKEEAEQEA